MSAQYDTSLLPTDGISAVEMCIMLNLSSTDFEQHQEKIKTAANHKIWGYWKIYVKMKLQTKNFLEVNKGWLST